MIRIQRTENIQPHCSPSYKLEKDMQFTVDGSRPDATRLSYEARRLAGNLEAVFHALAVVPCCAKIRLAIENRAMAIEGEIVCWSDDSMAVAGQAVLEMETLARFIAESYPGLALRIGYEVEQHPTIAPTVGASAGQSRTVNKFG